MEWRGDHYAARVLLRDGTKFERAPLRWRRLFVVAIYTYAREGELEALEWGDVDFDGRTVHIHRAVERRSGEVSTTKSEHLRRIPLEEELVPLLPVMRARPPTHACSTCRRRATSPNGYVAT